MINQAPVAANIHGYVIALVASLAAFVVRYLIDPILGDYLPYVTFFVAIAGLVWYSRTLGPPLTAIMLGAVLAEWFFAPTRYTWHIASGQEQVSLAVYFIVTLAFLGFGHALHKARLQAELVASERDEQRERLRTTLASIGDAVIATDVAGRVTNLNAVAESLTGWRLDEALGAPLNAILRIVNERSQEPNENSLERVLSDGRVLALANHTVLSSRDGSERPIDMSAAPIRCAEGKIVGCVLVFRDVTVRIRAEQVLRESEARKAAILDTALDCIITMNHEGKILDFNAAAEHTFGYVKSDVIGKDMADHIVPPALREAHRRGLRNYLASGRAALLNRRIELTALRADGTEFPTELAITRIPGEGDPVFTAYLRDITAEKRLQEIEQESQRRLRFVMDSMPQKIFTAAPSGDVDYFNRIWTEFTGLPVEKIQEWGWTRFIHPEDLPGNLRVWKRSLESGEPYQFEHRFRRADGDYRWHISRAVPMRDERGKTLMWLGSSTEIHEQRETANQLRRYAAELSEADRRKDEFLAMLAHELRNPLAPLRNAAQVLHLAGGNGETIDSATQMIERQVGQMARLVDDLLDVSRISRGKIDLRKERVELASVVHHAVEAVRPLAQEMGHDLRVEMPDDPIYLDADPARLAQVIGNLLNNACKFTDTGGRVELEVVVDGADVVIRVRDDGIGISPDNLARIFDMFMQVDTSLERSGSGLGLGVTLVKSLVEMHDGSVTVRSDGVGQGSEFIVRLPTSRRRSEQAVDDRASKNARPASQRILVVDDNRDAALSLALLLEQGGHQTHMAFDGLDALQKTTDLKPDVVLLDIGLPKLNGYEVARQIREQAWGRAIVLIAMTGWGKDEDRKRSQEAGFDDHMVKPVAYRELMQRLADVRSA